MITHANIAWTVESLRRRFALDHLAGKRLVSYLPMAHIAERMTSHYQQAFVGFEVTTCPDPGQIGAYLREVRPNIVFGVPRVWEKIHAGVQRGARRRPRPGRRSSRRRSRRPRRSSRPSTGIGPPPSSSAPGGALDDGGLRRRSAR